MTAEAGRMAFGREAAFDLTPAGLEQYKLDRLLELRAVIESLRTERGDELLADVHASMGHSLV